MILSVGLTGPLNSLNQCSLSQGLEHCPVSVIISRQMNPKQRLTSPT